MATNIPKLIGNAFVLNMSCHIPVLVGVLLTRLNTLILLRMHRYGIIKLDAFITLLLFLMFGCYFESSPYTKPKPQKRKS